MNIYLVCNAGMSTSILVKKMQDEAKKLELEVNIEAFSVEILDEKIDSADVVLLGPQIRHMFNDVKKVIADKCPVEVIDMRDYGMIRGDKVLEKALKMLQQNKGA
jgi:cellobiose PTS system EIIB component